MLPKGEGEVLRHYSRGDDALEISPTEVHNSTETTPRAMSHEMDGWMDGHHHIIIIVSSSHHDGAFIFQKDGGKMKI
eukprot:scaffold4912_cov284-Chaetoceros_neogracile.AAC.13